MTVICLVRHGETDWNRERRLQGHTDTSINLTGIQQAHACGQILKEHSWDGLITSPLRRAVETARIIHSYIKNKEYVLWDEFAEIDYGKNNGTLFQNEYNPLSLIKLDEVKHRVRAGLERIHNEYPSGKIIVVTHGVVIRLILNEYTKDNNNKTEIYNGSMSLIQGEHPNWSINTY